MPSIKTFDFKHPITAVKKIESYRLSITDSEYGFHINDNSLHGSDGCNGIRAEYIREKETFNFKNIISTGMTCPNVKEQIQAFLLALKKTASYKYMITRCFYIIKRNKLPVLRQKKIINLVSLF